MRKFSNLLLTFHIETNYKVKLFGSYVVPLRPMYFIKYKEGKSGDK